MNAIDQVLLESTSQANEKIVDIHKTKKLDIKNIERASIFIKSKFIPVLLIILCMEAVVATLGAQFYKSIGYSIGEAIVISLSIEIFFMFFSSQEGLKALIMKMLLFSISITTLSYSSYTKDTNIKERVEELTTQKEHSLKMLATISKKIELLDGEEKSIEADMKVYREKEMISKGNRILSERRRAIQKKFNTLLAEQERARSLKREASAELSSQSFINNISKLADKTKITIITFAVIQIAICIALPSVFKGLRE